MSGLDDAAMPHNTPELRASLVNAPSWADGFTFDASPSEVRGPGTPFRASGVTGRSSVLFGSVASGKTGLAVCALRAYASHGYGSTFWWNLATAPGTLAAVATGEVPRRPSPCWFESWPRLLALHRRQRWDEEGWFETLEERVAALALDDVGVDAGTPYRESFLLRHVEWAAAVPGRVLLLTINDRPVDWPRVLGERVSSRLLDEKRFLVAAVTRRG